jgi:hypothetical protein
VVVAAAGREEHDAPVLAGPGLDEAQHLAIEAPGGVEIADEERDVTEVADGEPARRAGRPRGCVHDGR